MPGSSGYVGILSLDLHFPENHSLKGKRKELLSLKANLAVASALPSRRSTITTCGSAHGWCSRASPVSRGRSLELLDGAERYVLGQGYELLSADRRVVTIDD